MNFDDLSKVAEEILKQTQLKEKPRIGIICGSGLNSIADCIKDSVKLSYDKIPGFPTTQIAGHKGNLLFGYLGGKYVACMQGRIHLYEHGMNSALCTMPVRILYLLGVDTLIVSNAAGGVNPKFKRGDLMIIKDHISIPAIAGFSPLSGPYDARFGERFISLHQAYDKKLRKLAMDIAERQKLQIHEGIYAMTSGPQFETPAETHMLKQLGADAIGTIIADRSLSRKLAANLDVEQATVAKHEEVLEVGKSVSDFVCKFISEIVQNL